ncbi:uncharacterized protein V6R79_021551 [Siganus canaliculatus]
MAASGGSLEATLDRKLQNVTNTMESIQGLSTWCIDNKKYHSVIVRQWIKCLRKSDPAHRLNLVYLANDVIQNCKRKNAIVYRTAFAEVLRDAFVLVNFDGDHKVIKSVERILSIWEDRGVYSGTLINELRSSLVKEESPPETPVEQKTPVESKADLRSKVVAEFVPQALVDELLKYKRSVDEVDLREKQLAAMRVDICNSETLKRLKDKAGGKKFSKDFEEGSAQLQEFVKFLTRHSQRGPPLMEALSNADIFYEMQYKEVKIVANAYQTFANRVSHLKRKLDALKSNLPDLDDSPIPSPSADAPSPTGSESPFHGMGMAHPDPDLDGSAMDDDAEPPAPSPLSSLGGSPKPSEALGDNDNREVEDMELSDEEAESGGIIVENRAESPISPEVSAPAPEKSKPSVAAAEQPRTQSTASVASPVEGVDLTKIGSILNSLNSVMKSTGPLGESPPPAAPAAASSKTTPPASVASQDGTSLVNLLSKVDVSPADLLSALSKVQSQSSLDGITSLLSSPAASDSPSRGRIPPSPSSTPASAAPAQNPPLSTVTPVPSSLSSTVRQSTSSRAPTQASNPASALVQALHRDMDLTAELEQSTSSQSLESKIHNFLQGNSAFTAFDLGFPSQPAQGGNNLSPVTGAEAQDGTPVRDEGGGTPTQDEVMDKPAVAPFASNTSQSSAGETFYQSGGQKISGNPPQPGVGQNGQVYQPYPYVQQEMPERGITAPVAHYQPMSAQAGGPVPGDGALGSASSAQPAEGFQGGGGRGWYGDIYPEGNSQQPRGYSVTAPGGAGENRTPGLYSYQTEQNQQPPEMVSHQGSTTAPDYFSKTLPPVPKFPPPPQCFDVGPPSAASGGMMPHEQQPVHRPDAREMGGPRPDNVISGMVVHDHQHKSVFHPDERPRPPRPGDLRPPHPGDLRLPHPDDLRYHDEQHHHHDAFFPDDPYHHPPHPHHPDDSYYRPGSPPHHYPRGPGRFTPPLSPSEDSYYSHEYQEHSPPPLPPPHYGPRRPPPPHLVRHPHRPPHPSLHPRPRGPPRPPFPRFHGPDPRMRGKRPGPRGGGNGPMFAPKRPFLPPRY